MLCQVTRGLTIGSTATFPGTGACLHSRYSIMMINYVFRGARTCHTPRLILDVLDAFTACCYFLLKPVKRVTCVVGKISPSVFIVRAKCLVSPTSKCCPLQHRLYVGAKVHAALALRAAGVHFLVRRPREACCLLGFQFVQYRLLRLPQPSQHRFFLTYSKVRHPCETSAWGRLVSSWLQVLLAVVVHQCFN